MRYIFIIFILSYLNFSASMWFHCCRSYKFEIISCLYFNGILFSIFFMYFFIEGLSIFFPCFCKILSKYSLISVTEYESSGSFNSNFKYFYMYIKYDKATHLSFVFKFILYVKFSNSLWESDVPLFLEFINIVSILFITLLDSLYCYILF